MKNKRYIVLVTALIGSWCCKTTEKNSGPASEWSFQNRATGAYFFDDNGRIKTGESAGGDAYRWIAEATGTRDVRLKNKKTGLYLLLDENGQPVTAAAPDTALAGSRWQYRGFTIRHMKNCSWYTITNAATGDSLFLAERNNGLSLVSADRNADSSLHWTLVREGGSILPFAIGADSVTDASFLGDRIAKALSATEIVSNYHGNGHRWQLQKDISAYPRFEAPGSPLIAGLYNMALEEMVLNLRDDSTFRTGELWPDTWTRDAVYSIYFAFSWINPSISLNTLRKQTLKNPREALQDTGTGGSWPISTDRVVWAIAAWEYYLATGDKNWLEEAYTGLRYTAEKDIHVAFDPQVGLFRGEACSMDWRTHTYPNWFSNENIGESFSTGTNALHFFCYRFLEQAGRLLGKDAAETGRWKNMQEQIRGGLNRYCWNAGKGLYTAYLYPAFLGYRKSDRVDIMSNGLCTLLGVTDTAQTRSIVENYPLYPYGGAVLYPTIPDDFAYHNKSIWAVWQTPLMYTARNTGHSAVALHLMRSLVRQGAMFLTHKENMTYDTGFDDNTALNSNRQLWSVAAYLSMVYRMLFGMELTETGMRFTPVVPEELVHGPLSLHDFRYRNALLSVSIEGHGNKIAQMTVNGKEERPGYELPADATGRYDIVIKMENAANAQTDRMNLVNPGPGKDWSPVEPISQPSGSGIAYQSRPELQYTWVTPAGDTGAVNPLSLNGRPLGFYSLYSTNKQGFASDLAAPVLNSPVQIKVEAEAANRMAAPRELPMPAGFSGGYAFDATNATRPVVFDIDLPEGGDYAVSITGSNGHGPHDVFCYIRSVFLDGQDSGTFILESSGNWNSRTRSNQLLFRNLAAGRHKLELRFDPEHKGYDNNMSFARGDKYRNEAMIDYAEWALIRSNR